MSSSDSTVSSRPNSFIKARSLALLIFMRRGFTFSPGVTTGSPARSDSMSDMSISSPESAEAALGLRPRLAPVLGGASDSAAAALGGRPGFFLMGSNSAAAVAGVALALALGAGTGVAFLTGVTDFFAGIRKPQEINKINRQTDDRHVRLARAKTTAVGAGNSISPRQAKRANIWCAVLAVRWPV